ncbi:unnamed protein product, partial [Mesorhabditis belari]|uniref:C-type lectin domain-containing protein n=1 Tax=Mesorhabditis belari TaxID=2138241 RepID=A0AAF3FA02_9BILA
MRFSRIFLLLLFLLHLQLADGLFWFIPIAMALSTAATIGTSVYSIVQGERAEKREQRREEREIELMQERRRMSHQENLRLGEENRGFGEFIYAANGKLDDIQYISKETLQQVLANNDDVRHLDRKLKSKTQEELVEAREEICELEAEIQSEQKERSDEFTKNNSQISQSADRSTKIDADLRAEIDSKIAELSRTFSALKADLERELNEAREKNAEVEGELRSENIKLRADLYVFQSRNARELNERREKNAEVERELRSENIELRADLATKTTELRAQIEFEKENKAGEIAKLLPNSKRTMTLAFDLNGWSYLEQTASWYKAIDQKMTFDEAVAYCGSKKSHLVTIHSQEENDFVQELAKSVNSLDFFWIGLKRNPNKENAFEWTDGSSVDFTKWDESQPDSNTHAAVRFPA